MNARSTSCATCAARTSSGFSSCLFRRSSAASAAAHLTCTASARRWRGSTWAWPRPCWRHSWAATRSPSGPRRSRRSSGSRASPKRVCCSPTAPPSLMPAAIWARLQTTADRVDGRRPRGGISHQRQQAVDQQRRHRRRLHRAGEYARGSKLVHRGAGCARDSRTASPKTSTASAPATRRRSR